ncbi:hypothetical protein [Kordiimonas gwangyangensis]|uniref:hypothetical protein n=1 Tax=Kordiimonas gwangyangensis TaxID=288022 RepID=UPI00036FA719|nr:hypothetical protein [Kordiimonas gwangyangensis]
MAMHEMSYEDARPLMKPGDVIAFSGKGHFSEIIKMVTFSEVSHVGVVLQTQIASFADGRYFNQIIEAATVRGFSGVNISRFSERMLEYQGAIWWLPIRKDLRTDEEAHKTFYNFLFGHAEARTEYDLPQALKSAADKFDDLPFNMNGPFYNKEDFARFFCSELVAAGLERAGIVGTVNCSEVTPIDLCRWDIYEQDYFLLKPDTDGSSPTITRHNTLDPSDWNL